MTISILLVDDHQLIREGLRRAFERTTDCSVVAEAASVREGLAQQGHHHAKVVITDLRLPDGSGLDLVRSLRKAEPDLGLVVLTMYPSDEQLFLAIEAGASAFLAKDLPSDEVHEGGPRGRFFTPIVHNLELGFSPSQKGFCSAASTFSERKTCSQTLGGGRHGRPNRRKTFHQQLHRQNSYH